MKAIIFLSMLALIHGAAEKKVKITGAKGSIFEAVISNQKVAVTEEHEIEDILTVNKKFPSNGVIVEGDMMTAPKDRNAITDTTLYWDTKTIPVSYSPFMNLLAISGIEDARREYEMRTCLSFVDRTNEQNYLNFEPQSGCWSYVGMLGGRQTVSIGSGCEGMSTVVHEIMHAIGIYHEQSRPDRDDYITIDTQNIDADKVYNFDKYGYDFVDDRRIAYDYNSVMHYGETAFSNNGEKTILTRDPQFQHMIGQRRTFSEGDVTMINRMYDCSDPLRVSYSCNFEEDVICGYVQDKVPDDIEWVHYKIGETDGSQISSNLPQTDGTQGKAGTGSYMLLDTSSNVNGQKGYLTSMRLKSNTPVQCMELNFYMDLEVGSSASLNVYVAEISASNGDILSQTPVATFGADYGAQWITDRRNIQASSVYKLMVEGTTGGVANDVIAIDDISILDKPCDTTYFTINEFSALIASSQKGDYLYGPNLVTEEGYNFRVLMYPQGSSSGADGYVGMYFCLAQGPNDDNLQWPFYNQVVQMMVVDQDQDAVTRMNHYSTYITGESGGSTWEKPTSSINSCWGYANFMPLDDLMNNRNFLKHDAVVISINVKNMNSFLRDHPEKFAQVHPPKPIMKTADHDDHHHEHHDDHHHEVNINVNVGPKPSEDTDEEKTVSPTMVGGVAFACAFAVFMLMSLVIVCVNQSHKQAMTAITIANHSTRAKSEEGQFTNMGYKQEKI